MFLSMGCSFPKWKSPRRASGQGLSNFTWFGGGILPRWGTDLLPPGAPAGAGSPHLGWHGSAPGSGSFPPGRWSCGELHLKFPLLLEDLLQGDGEFCLLHLFFLLLQLVVIHGNTSFLFNGAAGPTAVPPPSPAGYPPGPGPEWPGRTLQPGTPPGWCADRRGTAC